LLFGRRYNRAKKATHRPEKGAQIEPLILMKTAERLAEQHGVSRETVKRAAKFAAMPIKVTGAIGGGSSVAL
jgi:hypothetical protein